MWEFMQTMRIYQAQSDAQDAKSAAFDAQTETRYLKDRIQTLEESAERLSLATMALAAILRDRFSITEKEIDLKIQDIDLRDGKLDGRFRQPTNQCTKCRYLNAANRRRCLYCGDPLPARSTLFAPPPIGQDHLPDSDPPPKKP